MLEWGWVGWVTFLSCLTFDSSPVRSVESTTAKNSTSRNQSPALPWGHGTLLLGVPTPQEDKAVFLPAPEGGAFPSIAAAASPSEVTSLHK